MVYPLCSSSDGLLIYPAEKFSHNVDMIPKLYGPNRHLAPSEIPYFVKTLGTVVPQFLDWELFAYFLLELRLGLRSKQMLVRNYSLH